MSKESTGVESKTKAKAGQLLRAPGSSHYYKALFCYRTREEKSTFALNLTWAVLQKGSNPPNPQNTFRVNKGKNKKDEKNTGFH